eukprot:6383049-Heterocapsa_arctica.AAC.1
MSTCPKEWCGWSQIVATKNQPKAVTATGKPLTIYGARQVRCRPWSGLEFELKFVVSDVTRPIVAVCDLLELGLVPTFEEPCLEKGNERVPLIM